MFSRVYKDNVKHTIAVEKKNIIILNLSNFVGCLFIYTHYVYLIKTRKFDYFHTIPSWKKIDDKSKRIAKVDVKNKKKIFANLLFVIRPLSSFRFYLN